MCTVTVRYVIRTRDTFPPKRSSFESLRVLYGIITTVKRMGNGIICCQESKHHAYLYQTRPPSAQVHPWACRTACGSCNSGQRRCHLLSVFCALCSVYALRYALSLLFALGLGSGLCALCCCPLQKLTVPSHKQRLTRGDRGLTP